MPSMRLVILTEDINNAGDSDYCPYTPQTQRQPPKGVNRHTPFLPQYITYLILEKIQPTFSGEVRIFP